MFDLKKSKTKKNTPKLLVLKNNFFEEIKMLRSSLSLEDHKWTNIHFIKNIVTPQFSQLFPCPFKRSRDKAVNFVNTLFFKL